MPSVCIRSIGEPVQRAVGQDHGEWIARGGVADCLEAPGEVSGTSRDASTGENKALVGKVSVVKMREQVSWGEIKGRGEASGARWQGPRADPWPDVPIQATRKAVLCAFQLLLFLIVGASE